MLLDIAFIATAATTTTIGGGRVASMSSRWLANLLLWGYLVVVGAAFVALFDYGCAPDN
jgi:hypothetical protein